MANEVDTKFDKFLSRVTDSLDKWLEEFDELSPFWQNLNRHIADRLTKAILEESSGTQNQGRTT